MIIFDNVVNVIVVKDVVRVIWIGIWNIKVSIVIINLVFLVLINFNKIFIINIVIIIVIDFFFSNIIIYYIYFYI